MRQVIRHDVKEAFEDQGAIKDRQEMLMRGIVTKECFKVLMNYNADDNGFSDEEIWNFLIQFKLATEIMEPHSLYIPALIQDSNEKPLIDSIKSISEDKRSAGFLFSFQKCDDVFGLYDKTLCDLASGKNYYGRQNPGLCFKKGFSMKIENRRIGIVAGMQGSFKWTEEDSTKTVEFVIVEKDVNMTSAESTDLSFARYKVCLVFFNSIM
jgi:hypothetical protein